MTDDAGIVGWGEAPALKDWGGEFGRYFGESPGTTIEVVTAVSRAGGDGLPCPARSPNCMPAWIAIIKGYPYAKAAVEFAAYDLAGRQWGLPVHRLLGGAVRTAHPGHPFDRADGLRGSRARGRAGCARRHPHHQDQGRRRSRPRRRDGAARSARPSGRASRCASTPTRATAPPGEAIRTFRRMETLRPDLFRAAGRRHRAPRRGRARDRRAGHGRRERVERARRHPDHRAARGADRLDLHHQAGRPLSRHGGRGGCARGRHHLQRQRLGRDRRRQPRQPPARGSGAGRGAVLRCAGLDAGRGAVAARSAASTTRTT